MVADDDQLLSCDTELELVADDKVVADDRLTVDVDELQAIEIEGLERCSSSLSQFISSNLKLLTI
jgi:hypothetical protein